MGSRGAAEIEPLIGPEPRAVGRLGASISIFFLSCGTFALGVNEFITPAFLPEISDTFEISTSQAALAMSSFMIGAAVSSPLFAMLAVCWNRKYLLVSLMFLLALSAVVCALSTKFGIFIVGRVLSAISHSAYMGVGSVVAASLVSESKKGMATALFFVGLTISNLLGVPLFIVLGQKTNWRYTFYPVAGIALLCSLAIALFLPKKTNTLPINLKQEILIFKKLSVWLALLTSMFGYAGMLSSHTYFAEMMTQLAGYSKNNIFWLTALYGIGAAIGNFFGGKAADRNLPVSLFFLLLSLSLVLCAFAFVAYYKIPATVALFANGFTGFALIAPLMRYTISKAPEGPTLAAACNVSAMGVGVAIGIYLSGLTINSGYGYQSPNWVGSLLAAVGLMFFAVSHISEKCSSKKNGDDSGAGPFSLFVSAKSRVGDETGQKEARIVRNVN